MKPKTYAVFTKLELKWVGININMNENGLKWDKEWNQNKLFTWIVGIEIEMSWIAINVFTLS